MARIVDTIDNDEDLVNYTGYLDDVLRPDHELGLLTPLTELPSHESSLTDHLLQEQIRLRKKYMAGLHQEIKSLKKKLSKQNV